MNPRSSISIWFFIGLSLLVNGIIILGAGLYEVVHPPEFPPVLYQLHASVWWGGLLGDGQLHQASADQDSQDVSEHDGILNEDREKP